VFKLHDPATSQQQLKALPERSFWFRSRELVVKQYWKPDGKGGTELGFGAAVYPACLMLCDYIASRAPPSWLSGKRILELGCGLGLVSMVAKTCGATFVLATDGDAGSVSHAFENVSRNAFTTEEIGTALFRWGDDVRLRSLIKTWTPPGAAGDNAAVGHQGFDVVLASDIVAVPYAEALKDLVHSLAMLASIQPRIEIWLTYTRRHASEETFFSLMAESSFVMEHIQDVAPEFTSAVSAGPALHHVVEDEMMLLKFTLKE
jgi:predicted nicotinamide N-methyase